ncbi:MAG: thiamine pyrophosphate-dependent enzyme, partial [Janthinobacterium lividum]
AEFARFTAPEAMTPPPTGVDMTAVIAHLSRTLTRNAIITNGAGNFTVWVHRFFQYKQPHTELAPTSGAMGYGLPAALAAKLRHPDRIVVCVAGDGDFLMYPQELATALEVGSPFIVLVVNNGMYGTIRMHQERRFPGRISATRIAGPDMVALAKAFGAYAERVERTEDFPAAFERATSAGTVVLIDLTVDPAQITPAMRLQEPRS